MAKTTVSLTRREFLKFTGVAAGGASLIAGSATLAACGGPAQVSVPTSPGPVQLVYQDWRTEWFPVLAQEMLGKFNAEHPNIRVFYTPDPDNLEEKMPADMAAGTAPDILAGCCEFFPAWANAGHLLDLRPYVEADLDKETIQDFSSAQYNAMFTPDGKQYALPKYHGGLALYFNKDIFDAAGVEYPTENWTYDDYLAAMKSLTLQSGEKIFRWGSMVDVTWDRLQVHVNSFGGNFVDPKDPKHCVMAAPPALEALEWLRARMWDDRVMATKLDVQNLETRQAFLQSKIAMVEDGSWALKDILDGAGFRVGVAPFPIGPKRHVTLGTTDGFAIYSRTKNPDAAWELLKFLVSKDYGRAMARIHFLQPARASLVPEWVEFIRKEYPFQAGEVNIAAFADGQIKGYSVTSESFPNMVGVSEIADEAWDRILTLGKSPVSDMTEVCQKIEAKQTASGQIPIPCGCEAQG